jgi:hypothetical protein
MPGEVDPLYVAARTVLLDVLGALGPQRDAVILVGAQAIYLHTQAADLAVPEHTTDADVVLDPSRLHDSPDLVVALTSAGFARGRRVGAWTVEREVDGVLVTIDVDLMVPEAVGGAGRRAARLPGHGEQTARKARGLEASLVDRRVVVIGALDEADSRRFEVAVAGPAALLVSKLHKIRERLEERERRRLDDKDALDILHLLQATPTADLVRALSELLDHALSREVTNEALAALEVLFGAAERPSAQMAARAAGPLAPPGQIAQSCAILTTDLLAAMTRR